MHQNAWEYQNATTIHSVNIHKYHSVIILFCILTLKMCWNLRNENRIIPQNSNQVLKNAFSSLPAFPECMELDYSQIHYSGSFCENEFFDVTLYHRVLCV